MSTTEPAYPPATAAELTAAELEETGPVTDEATDEDVAEAAQALDAINDPANDDIFEHLRPHEE